MKVILVNSKKYGVQQVLVDDNDFNILSEMTWYLVKNKNRNTLYVNTKDNENKTIYMHRLILGIKKRTELADHIDLNGLNNQRSNLRIATYSQNNCNKDGHRNTVSKYKGVYWDKLTKKWRASIQKDGVVLRLGRYIVEKEAALAYNNAAVKLHGEFAYLNKVA